MEQEIYDLIQTGDEVQAILNKSEQLPSIEQLTQELNEKADVTDLEEEAADRAAGDAAVRNDLTAGTLVPKLSENLENWNVSLNGIPRSKVKLHVSGSTVSVTRPGFCMTIK